MTSLIKANWTALNTPACLLAESPRFAHNCWCWVDIDGQAIHRCLTTDWVNHPRSAIESVSFSDQPGCILPRKALNEYLLFGRQGIYQLSWPLGETHQLKKVQDTPFDPNKFRFNDGRADSTGHSWVSSLSDDRRPGAAFYKIDTQSSTMYLKNLIVGNGLAFSPDNRTLYFADTRQRCIWTFDFDPDECSISHQELFAEYKEDAARPDGATVASDGSYIVAVYEGYRLDRYSPDGKLLEHIALPVARPTMPCFGGPELDQLVVTSAPHSEALPNAKGFEDVHLIGTFTHVPGIAENLAT